MEIMHTNSETPAGGSQTEPLLPQPSAFNIPSGDDEHSGRPRFLSDKATQRKEQDHATAIREELILEHMPIVRSIARRIHKRLPAHVSGEDIYSAGVIGLLEAVDKFDPSKKVLFRTYAQCRIRGAILDSLRSLDWSPRRLRSKSRVIERVIQKLAGELKRAPEEQEIARELNLDLACYQQLLTSLKGLEIGTLHAEGDQGWSDDELAYVQDRPGNDALFRCLDAEMRELLGHAIDNLPERERTVVSLRYYEEATMKETASVLGVTESRVSQMHASAILHLRANLADAADGSRSGVGQVPRYRMKRSGAVKVPHKQMGCD
jgi:RNA polymerase sigma factor for flagellar operon FliA